MIDNDKLNKILSDARASGHDAKVRDVCFVFLCRFFDDKATAFRSLFDKEGKMSDAQIVNYIKSEKVAYLEEALKAFEVKDNKPKRKKAEGEDITFDENLAYMLKIKRETEEAMAKGEIDKKDAFKILADITVKLNDKFNVSEEVKDQIVVVNAKYDYICPVCSTEVSRRPISKEEAMEMYGLIEKK